MREVIVAATQMACDWDLEANLARASGLVRTAAGRGARIVLLQELFATPYFCIEKDDRHFALAAPATGHPLLEHFAGLAAELELVLPISFFERAGERYFNSVALLDADGSLAGIYRKSHIPDGPGYQEKFYFSPGDTGFRVWTTRYGRIGVAICWDQWFPECARALALEGAELLLYPSAIGSEPPDPALDSRAHWQRVMQGHAAANCLPVVASNRIGSEKGSAAQVQFYGSSFITDATGALLASASRDSEQVITAALDLDALEHFRSAWGLVRDRRPDLYRPLTSERS